MPTVRRPATSNGNVKKGRKPRPSMSSGRARAKPGSTGQGNYYHVEVRSKSDFVTFRTQDVGERGHIQRVAGERPSGSWATVKWLISKEDAHLAGGRLVPDSADARQVLEQLGTRPVHLRGDRFEARPAPAQRRKIKKAPAARRNK